MSADSLTYADAPEPLLVTASELAQLLKVSLRTLWRLRSAGSLPPEVKIGASVRWRLDEVKQWIADGCPLRKSARE